MRRTVLFTTAAVLVLTWLAVLLFDLWWPNINAVLAVALTVLLYTMYSSRETIE